MLCSVLDVEANRTNNIICYGYITLGVMSLVAAIQLAPDL